MKKCSKEEIAEEIKHHPEMQRSHEDVIGKERHKRWNEQVLGHANSWSLVVHNASNYNVQKRR